MRGVTVLLTVTLLVVASVGAATPTEESTTDTLAQSTHPDPESDVIGWENGVWHNESIDVDQSDGLSERELEVLVARGMARVEVIRDREFRGSVPVTPVARAEFRGAIEFLSSTSPAYRAWENQLWEALFIVDEPTDAVRESRRLTTARTGGLYLPFFDQIFVVSDAGARPVVDEATLVHELTHALQDQYYDLTAPRYQSATMDGRLASAGLIEGEASYVMERYEQRCESGEWECLEPPADRPTRAPYLDGQLPEYNLGMQVVGIQPYSDGPAYVADLIEQGGWDAVDVAHREPPFTTEQVIHPDRADEQPAPVNVNTTARDGWELLAPPGTLGYQTVGEAAIYAMFWYQGRANDVSVIDWRAFDQSDRGPADRFSYVSEPSEGWTNDRLYVYANDDRRGYVWRTKWDTERDAWEFAEAYREILAGHDAERIDERTWVIREGGFADAFRVTRDGRTVTVVNAPNASALSAIRPESTDRDSSFVWADITPQFYNSPYLNTPT